MKANKELNAAGLACISLTPAIKTAMSAMNKQEILEVYNDDPASREGVPAWCRLSGNSLVETKEINTEQTLFYIQKTI